jgi:hypothetical protein
VQPSTANHLAIVPAHAAGVESAYEAASEALQLAQLRLTNCQPQGTAAADASSHHSRSLGRFLSGSWFVPAANAVGSAAGAVAEAAAGNSSSSSSTPARQLTQLQQVSHCIWHVRRGLRALARLNVAAASDEAAAVLRHLASRQEEEQRQQQQQQGQQQEEEQEQESCSNPATPELPAAVAAAAATAELSGVCVDEGSSSCQQSSVVPLLPPASSQKTDLTLQCFGDSSRNSSSSSSSSAHKRSTHKGSAAPAQQPGSSTSSSIMRVAQGAAYPLITSLRRLSSVFVSGLGSTTAVALGTGLGVLRLGLGVVKFLVQLGVFASGEQPAVNNQVYGVNKECAHP